MVLPALLLAVAAQSAPLPAVVLGRVVDAGTGRPIPGAIVYVAGSAVPPQSRGAPPRLMTNTDGQFVIRGLRKGTLYLNVTREGYLDATLGQRRPMGSAQPLQLDDGQRVTNVDVRMWRPAVIAGTIVDEAGEPVIGARVTAFSRLLVAGRARYRQAADWMTDDRGQYRIAGLLPGDYTVSVVSPNVSVPSSTVDMLYTAFTETARTGSGSGRTYAVYREVGSVGGVLAEPGSGQALNVDDQVMTVTTLAAPPIIRTDGTMLVYPTMFYPASRTAAQAGVVAVRSGEERSGVDLQLVPVPTVRVTGFVAGPDGPAPYTAVRLMPGTADSLADPLPVAATVTDAGGAFTFPSVPSGDYTLSVMRLPDPPGLAELRARTSVIQSGGTTIMAGMPPVPEAVPPPVLPDPTLCAEVPLNVGNRSVTDIVVPLQPGPRATGRIEFAGATDPPSAQQIQNMRIALERADGTSLPQRLSFDTGHPDENARFITAGVPPGRYLLRVTNTIQGWFFLGAMADGRDISDTPVDLRKDMTDVVLTFTDRPTTITGIVRDGARVDGDANVIAFPVDSASWVNQGISQRRLRTTRAAKDGTYTLPPLPPGEYYVAAVKDEAGIDPYDPALLDSLTPYARQVRLIEGEKRTQDLVSVTVK